MNEIFEAPVTEPEYTLTTRGIVVTIIGAFTVACVASVATDKVLTKLFNI